MNAELFPRLIRAIHEQHLDGLLAVSPENVAYVVGFPLGGLGLGEPRWRQAAALVTWDGRTALLCVDAHAEAVRRRMRAETVVRSWGEFGDNPTHILADLLTEFHLSQSRIGTELDSLAAADFRVLSARFPNVTWAPAEGLLTRLRRVKGPRSEPSRAGDRPGLTRRQQTSAGSTWGPSTVGWQQNPGRDRAAAAGPSWSGFAAEMS